MALEIQPSVADARQVSKEGMAHAGHAVLEIDPSIADALQPMVKEALSRLPSHKQSMFIEEYKRKTKSPGLMLVLAIFFPIQLFVLGKTALAIAFWLTGGGMLIWWFIEVCLAIKRTNEFNQDVAMTIVRDIKVLH